MAVDEYDGNWQSHMITMGYTQHDISRASHAGMSNIQQAIEFLAENASSPPPPPPPPPPSFAPDSSATPTQQPPPPPLNVSDEWPALTQPLSTDHLRHYQNISTDESNLSVEPPQYPQPQFGALANARDSLDRLGVTEGTSAPVASPHELPVSHDDQIRAALELSRKDQYERDTEKAIQASKQDAVAAAASTTDHDMMRAIEESLKYNHRPAEHAVSWQSNAYISDPPAQRVSLQHPVGLRNIGNTCYLNSLLQVYYYLPPFRRAIMRYRSPPSAADSSNSQNGCSSTEKKSETTSDMLHDLNVVNQLPSVDISDQDEPKSALQGKEEREATMKRNAVTFVVQLQRLFAAMALGNRSCADPTDVARAMRGSDGNRIVIGAQQDASEFNELFLNMVEMGLKQDVSQSHASSVDEDAMVQESPSVESPASLVKDLFTIRFRQETLRSKTDVSKSASDAENPVTTNGETTAIIVNATTKQQRDLYAGLDDYALTRIEPSDGDSLLGVEESGQDALDHTQIPRATPLISSTAQGAFGHLPTNAADRSVATKSVWFTSLPPMMVIYLQRVSYNRSTLQADKVHDRYDFPLEIAFDRYMEKNRDEATRARSRVLALKREKERLNVLLEHYRGFPVRATQEVEEVGCSTTQQRPAKHRYEEGYFSAASRVQKRLKEALEPTSALFRVDGLSRESIEASLGTIGRILDHDREKCEAYERELKAIEPEASVYRGLDNMKYKLHAVLVHDGAPESGHYWTFIRDWNCADVSRMWMKLSDSMVSFISEEEMYAFSVGGNGRASAYCLIYVSALQLSQPSRNIVDESSELLPKQLAEEIVRDVLELEVEEQNVAAEQPQV